MRSPGLGLARVTAAGVLWGTGGLAVHLIHDRIGMSAAVASAWRMWLALIVLVAASLALRQWADLIALVRTAPVATCAIGAATAAYQALYFVAVLSVGVGVATVISLGLAPVLVAGWESLAGRRRPRLRQIAVLAMALAGLLLITGAGIETQTGPRPQLGVLAALGAAVGYAVTMVAGRTVSRGTTPLALTTAATGVGALCLLPLAAWAGLSGGVVVSSDPIALATLAWLGVATMALAYGLLYAGLRTTTSSAATIATLLEPVTAAVLAAALIGERLGVAGIAGGVLILLAVVAQRRPAVPTAPPAGATPP